MTCNGDCNQGRECNCEDKMTKQTEALKMAIEALETAEVQSEYDGLSDMIFKAINACKEALAEQPTQEPMIIKQDNGMVLKLGYDDLPNGTPFYTHPKQWQGLSDFEISELWYKSQNDVEGVNLGFTTQEHFFAGMIEAKLKEKNEK